MLLLLCRPCPEVPIASSCRPQYPDIMLSYPSHGGISESAFRAPRRIHATLTIGVRMEAGSEAALASLPPPPLAAL